MCIKTRARGLTRKRLLLIYSDVLFGISHVKREKEEMGKSMDLYNHSLCLDLWVGIRVGILPVLPHVAERVILRLAGHEEQLADVIAHSATQDRIGRCSIRRSKHREWSFSLPMFVYKTRSVQHDA